MKIGEKFTLCFFFHLLDCRESRIKYVGLHCIPLDSTVVDVKSSGQGLCKCELGRCYGLPVNFLSGFIGKYPSHRTAL